MRPFVARSSPRHRRARRKQHGFSGTKLPKSAQHFFRPFLPYVDAGIRVQQIARFYSRASTLLRPVLLPPDKVDVLRQAGKQPERVSYVPVFFPQNDLIPAAEDLDLFAREPSCFGSRTAWLFSDRNTRAVPYATSPPVYIRAVYTVRPLLKHPKLMAVTPWSSLPVILF